MVKSIDIILNSSIIISFRPKIVAVKDHAVLEHLDYEHSGHTGFASTEALNNGLAGKVSKTTDTNIVYATNLSGEYYKLPYSVNVAGYTLPQRDNDGAIHCGTPTANTHATPKKYVDDNLVLKLSISEAQRDYVQWNNVSQDATNWTVVQRKEGGYVDIRVNNPTYWDEPANKNYVDNSLGTLYRGNKFKAELIPDDYDEIIEFEKQVSGATFMDQTLATDHGTIVWCAATKAICGDAYYRKFLINTNGTQAGVTTFDPASGKLYVGKTDSNIFRWSGSNLLEVSKSLNLGETASTAYAGNKGKANADAIAQLQTDVAGKQNTLVSGTNIKTVNGVSILGSGDATIPGTPLTKITKTTLIFTAEEKTALINMQACLYYQSKLFIPTAYDSSSGTLTLLSHHAINGLTSITINLNSDTVSVAGKTLNSIIYKHVITFPSSRWFKANNTSIYMTQIVLYTNKVVSIDDNWDLFDLLETDFFVSGKIYYSNGSTTYSETLAYSISGTSYSAKKIICHEGSYFVLTQNPVSVSDDVRTIM